METKYILITPVYNEADFVEGTIKSVIDQTILPQKWMIVDDGSTDRTFNIVERYQTRYDFIVSVQLKREGAGSYYDRRTKAFLAGYDKIKNLEYDFIGSLDADICLEPTYYECILSEFDRYPQLGIASGIYLEHIGNHLREVLIDMNDSPGAIQMFRRQCYEQIGGYIPRKNGGDDTYAQIVARMKGWRTHSFSQYRVIHCRPVGTGDGRSILKARFRQGLTDYGLATHPLFMLAKSLRRAFLEKPYIIGSAARIGGFLYGYLRREERKIPDEAVSFVRKEQLRRLLSCVWSTK